MSEETASLSSKSEEQTKEPKAKAKGKAKSKAKAKSKPKVKAKVNRDEALFSMELTAHMGNNEKPMFLAKDGKDFFESYKINEALGWLKGRLAKYC